MLLNMIRTALAKLARAVCSTSINLADQVPFQRDIARQQKLLAMHRSLLAEHLQQRQQWEWTEVPDFLRCGIETLRGQIVNVKGTLRGWKIDIADHPDDQGPNDDIVGEIQHQRGLLNIYRKNLAIYLRQQEQLPAGQSPPVLVNSLESTRSEIQRIKAILRGFGVTVDDLPEEEGE